MHLQPNSVSSTFSSSNPSRDVIFLSPTNTGIKGYPVAELVTCDPPGDNPAKQQIDSVRDYGLEQNRKSFPGLYS